MIAIISKRFTFDAAHRLDTLPSDHKCFRLHGHTYEVEFTIAGPVDARGFVIDYAELERLWQPLHAVLDHHYLNDVPGLEAPSTENMAAWLWVAMNQALRDPAVLGYPQHAALSLPEPHGLALSEVVLWESSTTCCTMGHGCLEEREREEILISVQRALANSVH